MPDRPDWLSWPEWWEGLTPIQKIQAGLRYVQATHGSDETSAAVVRYLLGRYRRN